jgi:hypothetical protein
MSNRTLALRLDQRQAFLDTLTDDGNVRRACRDSGLPRTTAYRLRKEEPELAAAWDQAVNTGNDALEDEAIERALHGVEEEIWYGGKHIGTTRKYSDSLLMFLLKARRPEKFRDAAQALADADRPVPVIRVSVRGKDGEEL